MAGKVKGEFGLTFSPKAVQNKLKSVGLRFERGNQYGKYSDTRKRKIETSNPDKDGVQTSSTIIKVVKGKSLTPEQLVKAHGYDPKKFELDHSVSNFWKQTPSATLYQTKIWLKPKLAVDPEEISKIFNSKIEPLQINNVKQGRHNLVIPIFDIHMGIMTFDMLREQLAEIENIMSHGYKHIVIEAGGDLLHSAFIKKTQTENGTQLDHVDMIKAIADAKHFYDEIIRCALANSPKVDIYAIGGNHSYSLEYMFFDAVSDRFPQVEVHNSGEYRDAYSLDKVGILLGHGDKATKKLPMLFATEYPTIWAHSAYREIHFGHFHHETVDDDFGVVTRQLGTPKINDPYEKTNGYTMSYHKLQLFEYGTDRLKATYEV